MYCDVSRPHPALSELAGHAPLRPGTSAAAVMTKTVGNVVRVWAPQRPPLRAALAMLLATGGIAWAGEPVSVTRRPDAVMFAQAAGAGVSPPVVTVPAQRPAEQTPPPSTEVPSAMAPEIPANESQALGAPARAAALTPQSSLGLQLAQAEAPGRRLVQPMLPAAPWPGPTPGPPAVPGGAGRALPAAAPARQSITLPAGTGRLVQLPGAAVSVIAAEPRIARVEPTSQTTLFVMGIAAGRTTVVATAENGSAIAEYEVTVLPSAFDQTNARPPQPSALAMQAAVRQSVPGSDSVRITTVGRNGFVLNGTIPNASDSQRAEIIARIFAGQEYSVVNNLQLLSAIQVNVRVRIAEVSRQVTRELGLNWRSFGQAGSFLMGLRSGPSALTVAAAVASGGSSLAASPARLALGLAGNNYDINAVVDALAADQLISILAEPNLTAQSGETASFLAGGEFPIPVAATATGQITIEFKQFGVSLAFVPTVLATDRVNLRIRPEVSELTETGAVTVPLGNGGGTVTIPALSVRRAETTVELGSGQSFAIAGLLQRSSRQSGSGIAGIGEIPVLGALFRSNRFQRNETELVIIVTPYLVRPVSDPGQLAAPTDGFRPATDIDRVLFQRQIARGGAAAPQVRSRPDAGFILE
ncbi:MAG: fimbriae assembly protein [Rhodospirillales bacterium]|jgi:pilus assembly protein CpaC|nr:fimbriae assembly protein [Rhodospirillales bacterium]